MKYTILIEQYAQKQIMKLDKKVIPVIVKARANDKLWPERIDNCWPDIIT